MTTNSHLELQVVGYNTLCYCYLLGSESFRQFLFQIDFPGVNLYTKGSMSYLAIFLQLSLITPTEVLGKYN